MIHSSELRNLERLQSARDGGSAGEAGLLELHITVEDPEVIDALSVHPAGRARNDAARAALRIGVLALNQARGRVDAETVRNEGDRLLAEMHNRLQSHRDSVTRQIAESLSEYFDPRSGRFNERVERLVKKDGELEQKLRELVGREDSELQKTLTSHVGASSPIMKMLDPNESEGLLRSMNETLDCALTTQRDRILREFSLDEEGSALSRLVARLGGDLDKVVSEFSLDKEDSALSRLVKQVQSTQTKLSEEFSLDIETSALNRMKRELLEVLDAHKKASTEFQSEVKQTLSAMTARREESLRSTQHGHDYEDALLSLLTREYGGGGDIVEHTGNKTGLIPNGKSGDVVLELGPDRAAAGARVVIEAKQDKSYDLAKARQEIDIARKNRGADVGVFVFSARSAPRDLEPFQRLGHDIFVIWDEEDESSDVWLRAGMTVAIAIASRVDPGDAEKKAECDQIESAVRAIDKQADGLDEITTSATTIQKGSEKILERARIMKTKLRRQIERLDDMLDQLKSDRQ
ncbi:MAG: hypothetical protein V3T86_11245 [Planctomycetota bacterium]